MKKKVKKQNKIKTGAKKSTKAKTLIKKKSSAQGKKVKAKKASKAVSQIKLTPTLDPNAKATSEGIFGLPFSEEEAKVVFVPVPWDATTSYGGGTSNGPEAIKKASWQMDLFDPDSIDPFAVGAFMRPTPQEIKALNKEARSLALKIIKASEEEIEKSKALQKTLDKVNHMSGQLNMWVYLQFKELLEAGKSTLLKTMAGLIETSEGESIIGPSIKTGYFGQYTLEVLKPESSVFDEVRSGLSEASDGFIRNLLAAFLFRGDDVHKKVKFLSGGEKARLVLAVLLSQNNNLLVLDEPTNHLDISSREVLLEALKKYEGTVVFVSHDRFFLRQLANRVLHVDRQKVISYKGNYDYYLEKIGHNTP